MNKRELFQRHGVELKPTTTDARLKESFDALRTLDISGVGNGIAAAIRGLARLQQTTATKSAAAFVEARRKYDVATREER